jgi:hypothetical protein
MHSYKKEEVIDAILSKSKEIVDDLFLGRIYWSYYYLVLKLEVIEQELVVHSYNSNHSRDGHRRIINSRPAQES